ncbi:MAG: helix-turn-helix domain-containing protein [Acidimicrobiales bacterium]
MTRRHDGGNRRGDAATGTPSSVPEVGRLLRRSRTRQGLHLEDVAARTGLNLHQLEALETGTVDRIPDRVVVLQTLRRYADFLGLPGDRFVLAVVDHWPSPTAAPPVVPVAPRPVAAVAPAAVAATSAVAVGPPLAPTGTVPVTAVTRVDRPVHVTPHPTGVPSTTAQVNAVPNTKVPSAAAQVNAVPNTGVIPAVRPQAPRGPRARPSTAALSVAIGVLAVAVMLGIGALLVHRYEPRWLSDIGVTQAPTSPSTTTAGSGSHAHHPSGAPTQTLTVATTSPNAANLTVHSQSFQVTVKATGGSSWVQATQSGQAAPAFSGVLAPGQTQVFRVDGSLQLEVGSVSAHVVVATGLRALGSYVPPAAPYTMTISGAS